jgi:hypothetical protein
MSDIETIKARIRKLMAVTGDSAATDGEIDNAMRLAAKLLDAHHLAADDVGGEPDPAEQEMGRVAAVSQSRRFSTWESVLGSAICSLFGCVQHFISNEVAPVRVNGIVQMNGDDIRKGRRVYFYGPVMESKEAAELFQEWSRSIATMGVARWGGCFRGDGAMYCYGFAVALRNKAYQINKEREQVAAKPLPQLAGGTDCTALTLSGRYSLLKDMGSKWLKEKERINLHTGSGRSGYSAGSSEAYGEGKKHGASAEFSRSNRRRELPANG